MATAPLASSVPGSPEKGKRGVFKLMIFFINFFIQLENPQGETAFWMI